ncbi:hypothetical protein [Streptomyces griseorubiginosus]|nr:hypothetical protein [Streptomyces griseorubiginosus]
MSNSAWTKPISAPVEALVDTEVAQRPWSWNAEPVWVETESVNRL